MRKKSLFGLLAVFIAFSCMGVQCQKVTDPSSANYSLPYDGQNFSSRAECNQWCHDYYQALLLEANRQHEEDLLICGDDEECIKKANMAHRDAVKEIQSARQDCIKSCHDQGSVGGGF